MQVLLIVVLAAWVMALGRTILNLALVPRLRTRAPRRTPFVSVIIPARDEERDIERTVRAFLAQDYPELEIIVINDRSTDATGEILQRLSTDSRLTVIEGVEPPAGWLGKPWALHRGSTIARGELLLFVDADVTYAPGAISAAVAEIEDRDVPFIALMPKVEMRGFWEHVIMTNLGVATFTFMPLWFANRSRWRRLAVGAGTGNLVRSSDYAALGGHESLRDAVVDDVGLARLLRRGGRATMVVRADDFVSVRIYHGLGEIVRGFTKNFFSVFGRSYLLSATMLLLAVVFHLLPYALALMGNPIAIATIVLIGFIRAIVFHSLDYRLDNALLGHPLMIAAWCFILLRSIWFTGIRRQLLWRGRTYDARATRFGAD